MHILVTSRATYAGVLSYHCTAVMVNLCRTGQQVEIRQSELMTRLILQIRGWTQHPLPPKKVFGRGEHR